MIVYCTVGMSQKRYVNFILMPTDGRAELNFYVI